MYPVWSLQNSAFDAASDWGVNESYPIKVACVPALCTQPGNFSYRVEYTELDWSQFDLVLISDIEMHTQSSIQEWAHSLGLKRFLIALGGLHDHEVPADNTVYRPWWCYNLLRRNQAQQIAHGTDFVFDALLGARRPHRDYIALWMQHNAPHNLLTYREFFQGGIHGDPWPDIAADFEKPLEFPYVSPQLDPVWEVQENLDFSISSIVPWEIYKHTSYSIVCETLGTGGCFFMSEKTTKALFAGRVFVAVSNRGFYKQLRSLGFKTFEHIIDESWDSEPNDVLRYRKIGESIRQLSLLDPAEVYAQAAEVIKHNKQHLKTLQQLTGQFMQALITHAVASVLVANH